MERGAVCLSWEATRLTRMYVTALDSERRFRVQGEDRAANMPVGEAAQIDSAETGGVGIDGVLRDRSVAAAPAHRRFHHDDVLPGRVDPDRFQLLLVARHRLASREHEIDTAAAQDRRRAHVDWN